MPTAVGNPKRDREFRAFVEELFRRLDPHKDPEPLLDLQVPKPYKIRVKVLYSTNSPASN
jgi:hypothetical protein